MAILAINAYDQKRIGLSMQVEYKVEVGAKSSRPLLSSPITSIARGLTVARDLQPILGSLYYGIKHVKITP